MLCATMQRDRAVRGASPVWMKGPSLPAMRPPAMDKQTPTSLHTSVRRLSSPAMHTDYR